MCWSISTNLLWNFFTLKWWAFCQYCVPPENLIIALYWPVKSTREHTNCSDTMFWQRIESYLLSSIWCRKERENLFCYSFLRWRTNVNHLDEYGRLLLQPTRPASEKAYCRFYKCIVYSRTVQRIYHNTVELVVDLNFNFVCKKCKVSSENCKICELSE